MPDVRIINLNTEDNPSPDDYTVMDADSTRKAKWSVVFNRFRPYATQADINNGAEDKTLTPAQLRGNVYTKEESDVRYFRGGVPIFLDTVTELDDLDTDKFHVAIVRDILKGGTFTFQDDDLSPMILGSSVTTTNVTVGSDSFAKNNHGFYTGMAFILPTGTNDLSSNTLYYFIKVDNHNFKLASTYANAVAGTAIDITDSANITITQHLDPAQAIYRTGEDLTGASGAWMRQFHGALFVEWAGMEPSGDALANAQAFQATIDACPYGGIISFAGGSKYNIGATVIHWKQIKYAGASTQGTELVSYAPVMIETASTLTNGPQNAPIFEDMTLSIREGLDQHMTLVRIRGGNSFANFRRIRLMEPTEAEFYVRTTDVTGTFQIGETVTDTNGWTGRVLEVYNANRMRIMRTDKEGFANLIKSGSTITGATSGATATAANLTKRYKTDGVEFVASKAADYSDEMRPSVYGYFEQCEFFGLKIGSEFAYGNYKRANQTTFVDCSWQFCDYNVFDGQQTSNVQIFAGGQEIWNKTGIYSDGYHFKIFGFRCERGGVATEAPWKDTFGPAQVSTNGNYVILTGHPLEDDDEVILECARNSDRNDPLWPEGINPGVIYYVKKRNDDSIFFAAEPGGDTIDLTTTGDAGQQFIIRKMVNIAGQFGVHSDECALVMPQKQIGGGPVFFVFDGRRSSDLGTDTFMFDEHWTRVEELAYSPDSPIRKMKASATQTANLEEVYGPSGNLVSAKSPAGLPLLTRSSVLASTNLAGGVLSQDVTEIGCLNINVDAEVTTFEITGGAPGQMLYLSLTGNAGGPYNFDIGNSADVYADGGTHNISVATGHVYTSVFFKNPANSKWYQWTPFTDLS